MKDPLIRILEALRTVADAARKHVRAVDSCTMCTRPLSHGIGGIKDALAEADRLPEASLKFLEVLLELVESYEWSYDDNPSRIYCPKCGATFKGKQAPETGWIHEPGCELDAAMAVARSILRDWPATRTLPDPSIPA